MKADWCNIPVTMPWKGSQHFRELLTWLDQNIDRRDWDWDSVGGFHRIYYFAHQADALHFALKWA